MGITYAGENLLLEDPNGAIQDWIDRWHSLDELRPCPETMARRSSLSGHRAAQRSGRGLPMPNYPAPPPVRLNSLWWPTGASRWATFFAAVDGATLEKIRSVYVKGVKAPGSQQTVPKLILDDGVNEPIEVEMHMLSPRLVTAATPGEGEQSLWIIPLVDERYFWQVSHSGADFPAAQGIATELGTEIDAEIPATEYGALDNSEFNRRNESAGVLLDAIAWTVGMRFVRRLENTNHMVKFESSETVLLDENLTDYQQLSGGNFTLAPVPEKVVVTFRFWRDGMILDQDSDNRASTFGPLNPIFVKEITASSHYGGIPAQGIVAGTTKVIHSTYYAQIGYDEDERENPTNLSALEDLAEIIAADFYRSLDYQYDYTFAGLKAWKPTAYDDHVEYRFGCLNGSYEAFTRVQSFPPNFGAEVNCSQDNTKNYVFGDTIIGFVDVVGAGWAGGGAFIGTSSSVSVFEPDLDTLPEEKPLTDTEINVRAFSISEQPPADWVFCQKVNGLWMVIQDRAWALPQTEEATPDP